MDDIAWVIWGVIVGAVVFHVLSARSRYNLPLRLAAIIAVVLATGLLGWQLESEVSGTLLLAIAGITTYTVLHFSRLRGSPR